MSPKELTGTIKIAGENNNNADTKKKTATDAEDTDYSEGQLKVLISHKPVDSNVTTNNQLVDSDSSKFAAALMQADATNIASSSTAKLAR